MASGLPAPLAEGPRSVRDQRALVERVAEFIQFARCGKAGNAEPHGAKVDWLSPDLARRAHNCGLRKCGDVCRDTSSNSRHTSTVRSRSRAPVRLSGDSVLTMGGRWGG